MPKIENPVLRTFVGLMVMIVAAAAVGGLIYGMGYLLEPHYAQTYPSLYENYGYGFWTMMGQGLIGLLVVAVVGLVLLYLIWTAYRIGESMFGPEEEDNGE